MSACLYLCGRQILHNFKTSVHTFSTVRNSTNQVFRNQFSVKLWKPVVKRKTNAPLNSKSPRNPLKNGVYLLLSSGLTSAWTYTTALCCEKTKNQHTLSRLVEKELTLDQPFDWKILGQLVAADKFLFIAAVVCALVVAVINIKIPLLIGALANIVSEFAGKQYFVNEFAEALKVPALKLVGLYFVQACFTTVYIAALSIVGENIARRLREQLFSSILNQDIAFFDKHRTGELVNRLTTDIQDFKSSFKSCVSQGLRNITQTLGCFVSLYLISPRLTGIMVIVMPAIILFGSLIGSVLRKMSKIAHAQVERATSVADEAIGNIRTVRAFAMEDKEICLYKEELSKSSNLNINLGIGIGLFQGLSNLALNGIVLGVICVGGLLVQNDEMTKGDLTSFLVAAQTIQRSLAQLSLLLGHYVKGITAGSRVFEYLKLQPTIPLRGGDTIPYHCLTGDVEFKNVTFSYPTRPDQIVLKDFSIRIPPGKMVALCGISGGGKSTVAALLERFYDVDEGMITLDKKELRTLDPSWLRGQVIGFISQEPVLFATTIMENIRYGHPGASDGDVIEAAKLANAHEFISNFPRGYKTVLGERGVTVSGGQKQRIAIARAFLKNPSILILDEATSALDAESEKVVQEALDKIVKGRTVLVIAHRLSTIQNADTIAVLAGGIIAEMGTHQELKRLKGLYWDLIKQQEMVEAIGHKKPFRFGR